jgi:hypothetical protein
MKYITIALTGCLAVMGSAMAQEKKIKPSDLPAAVEKSVAAQSKGATISGFSEEKESGKTTYELQMTVNGRSKDLQMDESGVVIEVKEQVAAGSASDRSQDRFARQGRQGANLESRINHQGRQASGIRSASGPRWQEIGSAGRCGREVTGSRGIATG